MTRKILFVTSSLYEPGHSASTGGTISNYLMLSTIAEHCSLSILLLGSKANDLDDLPGAEMIRRSSPPWGGLQLLAHWNPYVRKTTKSVVSEHGPFDAVIASSDTVPCLIPSVVGNAASVVGILAFENFGLRAPSVTQQTKQSLFKQSIVRRFADARIIRHASFVATNSRYMYNAVHGRFACDKNKIHVIVEKCQLDPDTSRPPSDNRVGFVNRSVDKNLNFVVEMAARTPDIDYFVYGHTPTLYNAPPNLRVKGWSNDRQDMFSSAKVWLVPSLWPEPFGRVAIEAQAADRAAIVHATGGLPETVLDSEFALDTFDPDRWENSIRKAMQMSAEDLSHNGARIREKFSSNAHDQSIQDLLEKIPNEICMPIAQDSILGGGEV